MPIDIPGPASRYDLCLQFNRPVDGVGVQCTCRGMKPVNVMYTPSDRSDHLLAKSDDNDARYRSIEGTDNSETEEVNIDIPNVNDPELEVFSLDLETETTISNLNIDTDQNLFRSSKWSSD